MANGKKTLLVMEDLVDRPANRSALTWARWAVGQGHELSILTRASGPLADDAASIGPVVDAGSVNSFPPARVAGRVGLAPVGRALKSRRLRALTAPLGVLDRVVVAQPSALDLLDWLPEGRRRVAAIVSESDLPLADGDRRALAGCSAIVAAPKVVPEAGSLGPRVVEGDLMVAASAADAQPASPPVVAIAGLAPAQFESFVRAARAVRREVPEAIVGWVRERADEERWDWPVFARGELVDLAGVVTSVAADGSDPVDAVVQMGNQHPLVAAGARMAGRPVIEVGTVDSSATLTGGELSGLAVGPTGAANGEREAAREVHAVDRVGSRILAALDGK